MAGAMMARVGRETVDLAVKARATVDRARMVLRVVDLVGREIAGPTGAALAVSGADPMVLLAARVVLAAGDRDVVPMVVARVDPRVLAAAVGQDVVPALAVRAEGILSSGWIRLTASSTKSCARLSP
jgi:hypothetical protein